MGAAFVAGGGVGQPGTPVAPPVNQFSVEHTATSDQLPLSDPAYGAVSGSTAGIPGTLTTVSLTPSASPTGR
jgi:hypothetical protein